MPPCPCCVVACQVEQGATCPIGSDRPYQGKTGTPPDNSAVTYDDLINEYQWDLPATRLPTVPGTFTTDFWSVMCNSNTAPVLPDRRSCKNDTRSQPQVGEVHVRYDCQTKTFWVLAYVYSNIALDESPNNMWAVNRCGASPSSSTSCGPGNQQNKFFQVSTCVCCACQACLVCFEYTADTLTTAASWRQVCTCSSTATSPTCSN
jgi:hypothetical protein